MKAKSFALLIAILFLPALWGQSSTIKIQAKVSERIKLQDQSLSGEYTILSKNKGGISLILKRNKGRFPASSDNKALHLKEGQSFQFDSTKYDSISIVAP